MMDMRLSESHSLVDSSSRQLNSRATNEAYTEPMDEDKKGHSF